jgi:hypothetical protein
MRSGLLAEFGTPEDLLAAIEALHQKGYRKMDAFTPHPFHGLEQALRLPRSGINIVVGPLGIAMAIAGYGFQWYCNALDYPINVGGRPPHSPLAFVPITFETGVLWTALFGMAALFFAARLTELHHPVFDVPGFERASIDTYWLGIDRRDRMFNLVSTSDDLAAQRPLLIAEAGIGLA